MTYRDVLMSRDDCIDAGGRATHGAVAEAWMPGAASAHVVVLKTIRANVPQPLKRISFTFPLQEAAGLFLLYGQKYPKGIPK